MSADDETTATAAGSAGDVVLLADRVITPVQVLATGWVHVRGERVAATGAGAPPSAGGTVLRLPRGSTVVPGLVDMHVHGTGGGDMTARDPTEVRTALRALAAAGVTSCVASLVTAPADELEESLSVLAGLVADPDPGTARLVGTHMEGPFLSPHHQGAHHGPSLRLPDLALLRRLLRAAGGQLRMMTLAPELPGSADLLRHLRDEGVVAAMGHTAATFDETREAVAAGISVGTHLFNGMRSAHHREPGPALSLLDSPQVVVELINDGEHVHPAVARVAVRAAGEGRLALISDGVAATAAPQGRYMLGRVAIRSHAGRVETADGSSLGGGACTLDQALRRAVTVLGMDLPSAVAAATLVPARALGLAHRIGSLAAGRAADLCVLDEALHVVRVMVGGQWVDAAGGPQPSSPAAGRTARSLG